jgi:hypothetical protein
MNTNLLLEAIAEAIRLARRTNYVAELNLSYITVQGDSIVLELYEGANRKVKYVLALTEKSEILTGM